MTKEAKSILIDCIEAGLESYYDDLRDGSLDEGLIQEHLAEVEDFLTTLKNEQ